MRRLDSYIFRQILGPFLFFVLVFTGVIWLGQSLRIIDTIVNHGQSALVFLEFTLLLLPTVLSVVLPVAAFAATLYAVNRLFSDSEIVVMFSSGLSTLSLVRPVLMFSSLVMAVAGVLDKRGAGPQVVTRPISSCSRVALNSCSTTHGSCISSGRSRIQRCAPRPAAVHCDTQ